MSISGASELLLEVYNKQVEQEVIDLIQIIERGSRRLGDLIERFLDISRLEFDSLNLENQECDLNEVIEECTTEMKYLLKRREIALDLELKDHIILEVDKLRIDSVMIMN